MRHPTTLSRALASTILGTVIKNNSAETSLPVPERIRPILGVNVLGLPRDIAADYLEGLLHSGRPAKVAFANANLVNLTSKDEQLKTSLRSFIVLNDGVGVNSASRLLHREPFPDNLNGTDFTPYFLDRCRIPLRIFLLGATPSVVVRAKHIFAERWPRHRVVGFHHGFFEPTDEDEVIRHVRAATPDLVFVAMGNGRQERWVERLVPELTTSAWGVGALFDYLTGEQRRAPGIVRSVGLEWAWRLGQEPRRLARRYLVGNPKFLFRVLCEHTYNTLFGRTVKNDLRGENGRK
ncbi:WecB/TagA/CpsF family glycosyltransferase [Pseudarthrobacter sp. R1]|uniref:WecB/TagA/CpsF family glycosyltransferase n=1 Tax=Pseudarthrobacter sp. R1 TaxID=2944934 RepID=UPI00210AF5C4|nr:WecB/TagA/CpsF family glycosyltransferase [Pseudarthrobacter sp. R1]MCQ6271133.1 WecB/TagA/CpsF family glycosyltransferase [Pseudarthrobacter sp. R1]